MRHVLALVAGVASVIACGGAVSPLSGAPEPGAQSDSGAGSVGAPPPPLDPGMFACQVDADCLAIAAGGCCPDGSKVAVNVNRVGDYQNAAKCTAKDPPPCVPPGGQERRVAECIWKSYGERKCEMVAVEDIACGGFVGSPHACPRGLVCEEPGNDGPGKCVEPRRDCRSTGCNMFNEYCTDCGGTFTCRSVHSGC